ncbi:MAG TPA: S8 family serine peptidase, partial [candidate division Zixibacteria bacterium]|nr:S8 family serine peptidase [candidate division Zixibacteria bacterium]
MKELAAYTLSLFAGLIMLGLNTGAAAAQPSLAPGLAELIDRGAPPDSIVHVVVFLETERTAAASKASAAMLARGDQIRQVTSALKQARGRGDRAVAALLRQHARSTVARYWIAPAYAAAVPAAVLPELAAIDGVSLVVEDAPVSLIAPVEEKAPTAGLAATVAQPLVQLGVPALWQKGLTGRGRLICSFDTGVKYDHAALLPKWRGAHVPLSAAWFSKVAPTSLPADAVGHGTHTMGIMVGSDGADTIGVAPDAEWITAGVIDQGRPLSTTIADILEAFQWALNPDGDTMTTDDVPDVILNSWGIPKGLFTPCDRTFAAAIENVEAAGVVTVFAAGNEGPNAMTLRNPADMVLSPLSAFAVGAVDANNAVASFSSRGPASCDQVSVKPELVAPGVSIRSSYKDGGYKVLTGTSMAAPFVAGLVALVRQYNPNVSAADIKSAFIAAARDLGPLGEDNSYGYGIVDAARLLQYIPDPVAPDFSISRVAVSGDGLAVPGERFDLAITLRNPAANIVRATATLAAPAASGVTVESGEVIYLFGGDLLSAVNGAPLTATF